MIEDEATGETERATTLDRFLSRCGLSALAEEQDIEWFEGRWMDFETEVNLPQQITRSYVRLDSQHLSS